MSGLELIQKIRRSHPDLKAIIITGLTDEKVKWQVLESGVNAYFLKPISVPVFLETVVNTLGLRSSP
jgi:DNA-binding response OmpR family regulator